MAIHSTLGLEIELGDDWHVTIDPKTGSMLGFRGGRDFDTASAGLSIGLEKADPPVDAVTHATRVMKRHVGQGSPEEFPSRLGGRVAFGYSWTDGLGHIATWFVPLDVGILLRIEYSFAGSRHSLGKFPRKEAEATLSSLKWVNQ